ncbi:RagB/SusD family nutrient uptake outer membrane protein [Sphingobacterium sp. LRF_L2]|uniref:RagB/SusD family nutrient uptake outer membrane protein n=1 Tax=Sphingobacterium sp. LRF_L2 TaxID=3369421 RepID=UPI003F60A494
MTKTNKWLLVCLLLITSGCSKGFLDVKSSASIANPSTIEDFQALLDNAAGAMNSLPPISLNFIAGEEYRITSAVWNAVPVTNNRIQQKNAYIWAADVYQGESGNDWDEGYKKILYANIALEGINGISAPSAQIDAWNNVKGSALFYRAWNHYLLVQQFCKMYSPATADEDFGLPLRLEADVTIRSVRSSLRQTYQQIMDDLLDAVELLPANAAAKSRPTENAARLLLAKVYIDMENYDKGLVQLDAMGDLPLLLIDFNGLSKTATYPFSADYGATNTEMLFFCYVANFTIMNSTRMNVEEDLLGLYEINDLRKTVYYLKHSQGNIYYRGSYLGMNQYFLGLSIPDALLLKAECLARTNRLEEASALLFSLQRSRFSTDATVNRFSFASIEEAVATVIMERRRELAFQGQRWSDLRRFNKEGVHAVTLSREIDGTVYTLAPNSDRYVWRIPDEVITLSGIEQNP